MTSWGGALLEVLGPNGQLLVNLVPELGLVIGKQPPVPDLALQDAQRHFHRVFRRFLGVFAQARTTAASFNCSRAAPTVVVGHGTAFHFTIPIAIEVLCRHGLNVC